MKRIEDDIINCAALEVAYQVLKDPNMRESVLENLDISDEFGEEVLAALHKWLSRSRRDATEDGGR